MLKSNFPKLSLYFFVPEKAWPNPKEVISLVVSHAASPDALWVGFRRSETPQLYCTLMMQ